MSNSDPTDTIAIDEAKQARTEREAFLRRLEEDDLKWLMSDKRGRRFMYRLLADTKTFSNPFVPGRGDVTSYQCGVQSVGQKYHADVLEHCEDRYETMITEFKKI